MLCYVLPILGGVGYFTGLALGLVGYALGMTLSPFVIGSITAIVSAILFSIFYVWVTSIFNQSQNRESNSIILFSALCFSGIAVGIGLSAAINAIPSIILDIELAAALGGVMGTIVPILSLLVAECIVIPVVEKIKERLSSQEKNDNCTASDPNGNEQQPNNTLESVDPSKNKDENKGLVATKT